MKIIDKFKNIIKVEIQGFFTERFINICKINNIKIWDIINITEGVIRFNIYAKDYKQLRKVARKTKCKVKIRKKRGIYFSIFKYRKRKWIVGILLALIIVFIVSTTFIWDIEIKGNSKLSNEEIINRISKYNIYSGKSKVFIDKNKIVKDLRTEFNDIAWVGIDILGTTMYIEFVEKVEVKNELDERNGDIIAEYGGVLTKVIPENGTALYKEGSYVEKDMVIIKGMIYSEIVPEKSVHAKGIVKANVEYVFEKEYKYDKLVKEYKNDRYTIGISFNDTEKYINYLNKNKNYDKLKYSLDINLFGFKFSIDWFKFKEYIENIEVISKEDLIAISNVESKKYIDNVIAKINNSVLVEEKLYYEDTENGIKVRNVYVINQDIGKFIERN